MPDQYCKMTFYYDVDFNASNVLQIANAVRRAIAENWEQESDQWSSKGPVLQLTDDECMASVREHADIAIRPHNMGPIAGADFSPTSFYEMWFKFFADSGRLCVSGCVATSSVMIETRELRGIEQFQEKYMEVLKARGASNIPPFVEDVVPNEDDDPEAYDKYLDLFEELPNDSVWPENYRSLCRVAGALNTVFPLLRRETNEDIEKYLTTGSFKEFTD